MIILHIKSSELKTPEIERELREMVVSYKTEVHPEWEAQDAYIEEDGKEYRTEKEIEGWVQQLKKELSWQRSLSGDGCYVDPDKGNSC